MVAAVRRVVTGHDRDGKAVVVFDGDAPNVRERGHGTGSTQLWRSFATPADNSGSEDAVAGDIPLIPPAGGSVFRIVEFAPESAVSRAGGTLASALVSCFINC